MFIELTNPTVVDIYRTKDRSKVRLAEPETMPNGRLWLNLTFNNDKEVQQLIDSLQAAIDKPLPKG